MARFGLLGKTLGHSYSPQLHKLLGGYDYDLFEVAPEALEGFLASGSFDGLNVTIPYKKAVIPYCAELTPTAEVTGSVNTIVRRADGTLLGDNTDYAGFAWMLTRSGVPVRGRKVLVLGDALRRPCAPCCRPPGLGKSSPSPAVGRITTKTSPGTRMRSAL